MSIRRQKVAEILTKFPKASTMAIARIAFKENPLLFSSAFDARDVVRTIRGLRTSKGHNPIPEFVIEKQMGGRDPFAAIPDGLSSEEEWGPVSFDGPMRCLVLSDVHIPYHDRKSLVAALRYGKAQGADTILLNGDLCDFYAVSFWEKDPGRRNFADELKTVREFLETLKTSFPKAKIIFKEGNHEERLSRYMRVKAPELLGMDEFKLQNLLSIPRELFVTDKRPIRLGKLNVLHGHEYSFSISNPVNPARGLFLRTRAHSLCGHFHQSSYHSSRSVEQKNIACWSTGCLSELHPDYARLNEWSSGFAFVTVDKHGEFEVQNKYISNGKVY